jgi:hypothetical protein
MQRCAEFAACTAPHPITAVSHPPSTLDEVQASANIWCTNVWVAVKVDYFFQSVRTRQSTCNNNSVALATVAAAASRLGTASQHRGCPRVDYKGEENTVAMWPASQTRSD